MASCVCQNQKQILVYIQKWFVKAHRELIVHMRIQNLQNRTQFNLTVSDNFYFVKFVHTSFHLQKHTQKKELTQQLIDGFFVCVKATKLMNIRLSFI